MARTTSSKVALPGAPASSLSGRPIALSLIVSVRPEQWTKNLLIFAGLLFARRLSDPAAVAEASFAFVIFCALSGAVYVINDLLDRESDREHPLKARRPIASGALSVPAAAWTAAVLVVAGIGGAFGLNLRLGIVSAAYFGLFALYSALLKHIVIIDVLTIAMGFVLRAVAGAVAIEVEISHWLLVCTFLLALFIAMAKRRHELVLLTNTATSHRPILSEYTPYLLDQMISVVTASTLIAYVFYTISPDTQQKFGTTWLGLTIPFPLYGILRYLYLVHQREGGGSPSDLLLTDRPMLACVVLWVVAVALIIYRPI
jgi:4-hydroxybenzoate polyprenyltransferase